MERPARSGTINLHSFTWHLYGKAARYPCEMITATRKSYYHRVATVSSLSGISHLTSSCYRYPCNTEASDAAPCGYFHEYFAIFPVLPFFDSTSVIYSVVFLCLQLFLHTSSNVILFHSDFLFLL